jgi:hypothetical protein
LVHPEDGLNLEYLAKRWHVTGNQLNDAILNTGSLSPIQLKAYLKKRNGQDALFFGLLKSGLNQENSYFTNVEDL